MATIKIGSVYIPVIEEREYPNQEPVRHPSFPGLLSMSYAEAYPYGVNLGIGHSPQYDTGGGSPSTYPVVEGGRTGIHDATEIVATVREEPYGTAQGASAFYLDAVISHQESGESPISLDVGTINVIVGFFDPSGSRYEINTSVNAVAVKYTFPDATAEKDRVGGYWILSIGREADFYNGAFVYSLYDLLGYMWIDLPWINYSGGYETYYDDEGPGPEPEPTPPFDPSEPQDYDPHVDDTSDTITIPGNPTIGVSTAGWVHVYKPSQNGLVDFGEWLFPNPELPSSADPTEIVNYLLLLCQTLANSRLIDYVLDCHIIPVTPQVGTSAAIKVGGRTATNITAPVVSSDYIDVTCGSLNIQEYFSGFQDYLYTKSKLYLPFVGFVDMIPEYWQAGTIYVDYKFNVIDGSFMAYVRSTSSKSQLSASIIAQYGGNACIHVPITGVNYSNMVAGLVSAAAAAGSAKSATAALGNAYSAANTFIQGGDMIQSNAYNATSNMMGVRYPYLLIERSVPSIPGTYMHSKGYPANVSAILSGLSGFTTIEDIDLSGIPLTQGEIDELRGLLKEGVYF